MYILLLVLLPVATDVVDALFWTDESLIPFQNA